MDLTKLLIIGLFVGLLSPQLALAALAQAACATMPSAAVEGSAPSVLAVQFGG
jgi:hypothetical protein